MNPQKIFYFCYDHQGPSGGQKQMYRHVDILNKNGYQAYAVHALKGFRLRWFKNDTRVIDRQEFNALYRRDTDYIVLAEDLGMRISAFPGKKIIFNQNIYYGFNALGLDKLDRQPYLDKSVKSVMTVSAHNQRYLKFIFPGIPARRIYYGIDTREFTYNPISRKKKVITILPKKSPIDNNFIYQAVSSRAKSGHNRLKGYIWKIAGANTQEKMAGIFRDSLIFIFLGMHDGCPLMTLEAMLSGALIVAYRRGPHCEYLNDSNSFLVDTADKLGLIKKVEEIAAKFEFEREALIRVSEMAREAAGRYSLEREEKSVLGFWQEIIKKAQANENAYLQKIQQ